ncbi:hypothetical protein M9Y10_035643 [Tritrichomonas musculus]|uniref:Helicase C-terminal domain-containing protein n=1 Tax=Tritrichomonas musculus TaxID=1915356 RepID=A0ABR2GWD0_9EUKA
MAIDCGGLHVIISFFPVNLRVECQGLGRAGRQGQPGSCQIIYSSDTFAGNVPKASEDILRIIYEDRTESVRGYSSKRLTYVQKENLLFNVLISYFSYVKQMRAFLESPQGEQIIRFNGGENLGNHYDSESILNDLSLEWSKFYTSISNGEVELKENLFDCFKSKYEEKMIILTDVFNEYIQGNDYLTTNSGSIDTPNPSNSLDINRKYDKSIIGFTGSKPQTKNFIINE